MAKKRKRSKSPVDEDKGRGNRSNVSPQAAVFRRFKPKKNLRLVPDEYERRFGDMPTGRVRIQAKPYNQSLTTGGSGDPTKSRRKKRYNA